MRYKFMPLILIALLLLPIGCGQQDSSSHNYVGSVNSDKYHVPSSLGAKTLNLKMKCGFLRRKRPGPQAIRHVRLVSHKESEVEA